MESDGDILHADLCELLALAGMGDHARPQSPHEVFQEALDVLREKLALPLNSRQDAGGEESFIDYATGADSLGTFAEGVRANGSRLVLDGPHPGRPEIAEAWVRGARFATFFAPHGIDATPVLESRITLAEGYHAEPGDAPGDPWRVYLEIPARFGRGKRSMIGTIPLALIEVLRSTSRQGAGGQPMSTALEDRPIMAWCDHEAGTREAALGKSSLYAAHAESWNNARTGFHVVEWGGASDAGPDEPGLPDWWFVAGSEFEVVANPVEWWPLPEDRIARINLLQLNPPSRPTTKTHGVEHEDWLLGYVKAGGPKTAASNTDCRSEDGITVGIIDAIITLRHLLTGRDFSGHAAQQAIADLVALLQPMPLPEYVKRDYTKLMEKIASYEADKNKVHPVQPDFAVDTLLSKAEGQVAYWRERQTRTKCIGDAVGENGEYTPIGDDAAWNGGYCNGRYSEADWWLKTITGVAASRSPSAADALQVITRLVAAFEGHPVPLSDAQEQAYEEAAAFLDRNLALGPTPAPRVADADVALGFHLRTLCAYARWQIDEGEAYHPTLRSALAAAEACLKERGLDAGVQIERLRARLRSDQSFVPAAPTQTARDGGE